MKKILSLLCTLAFGLALPFYGAVDDKTAKPNYVFKLGKQQMNDEKFKLFKQQIQPKGMLSEKDNVTYLLVPQAALLKNAQDNTQDDPAKIRTSVVKARLREILGEALHKDWKLNIQYKGTGNVPNPYPLLKTRPKTSNFYHVLDQESKDCFVVMIASDDVNTKNTPTNDSVDESKTNDEEVIPPNNNPKKGHYWYLFIIVPAVLGIGYYVYATFLAPEEEDLDDDGGDGDEEMDDLTEEEMDDDV